MSHGLREQIAELADIAEALREGARASAVTIPQSEGQVDAYDWAATELRALLSQPEEPPTKGDTRNCLSCGEKSAVYCPACHMEMLREVQADPSVLEDPAPASPKLKAFLLATPAPQPEEEPGRCNRADDTHSAWQAEAYDAGRERGREEAASLVHATPVEKDSTGDFEDAWDFKYRVEERIRSLAEAKRGSGG